SPTTASTTPATTSRRSWTATSTTSSSPCATTSWRKGSSRASRRAHERSVDGSPGDPLDRLLPAEEGGRLAANRRRSPPRRRPRRGPPPPPPRLRQAAHAGGARRLSQAHRTAGPGRTAGLHPRAQGVLRPRLRRRTRGPHPASRDRGAGRLRQGGDRRGPARARPRPLRRHGLCRDQPRPGAASRHGGPRGSGPRRCGGGETKRRQARRRRSSPGAGGRPLRARRRNLRRHRLQSPLRSQRRDRGPFARGADGAPPRPGRRSRRTFRGAAHRSGCGRPPPPRRDAGAGAFPGATPRRGRPSLALRLCPRRGPARLHPSGPLRCCLDIAGFIRFGAVDAIVIRGGNRLVGTVRVSGSKNAALPCLAASLLAEGTHTFRNVPDLADIGTMSRLLRSMGCHVERSAGGTVQVYVPPAPELEPIAPYELVKTRRASVLALGPLVARYGKARVSLPGGCAIGARPIDQHIKGLEQMGAEISLEHGYVQARAKRLRGARITFDLVTVTGTENLLMAATLAEGTTVLENAAREPEVVDLARALVAMGARIEGAGTDRIEIEGVDELRPANHEVI